MGATELAPKIRKQYQTNELAADSTEFGTKGSEESLHGILNICLCRPTQLASREL